MPKEQVLAFLFKEEPHEQVRQIRRKGEDPIDKRFDTFIETLVLKYADKEDAFLRVLTTFGITNEFLDSLKVNKGYDLITYCVKQFKEEPNRPRYRMMRRPRPKALSAERANAMIKRIYEKNGKKEM